MLMRSIISGLRDVHYTISCWKLMDSMLVLHNWLLEIDGLNADWSGVSMPVSDWEGNLGDCKMDGINVTIPWSLVRLSQ